MSEYYKSLISDDEVIRALIRESKMREGTLQPTRLKPNLNFLKRTVSSLVSTNTRIDKSQNNFKSEYLKDSRVDRVSKRPESIPKKPKINVEFAKKLVLETKIDFVKSTEKSPTAKTIKFGKINFLNLNKNVGFNKHLSSPVVKKGSTKTVKIKDITDKEDILRIGVKNGEMNERISGRLTNVNNSIHNGKTVDLTIPGDYINIISSDSEAESKIKPIKRKLEETDTTDKRKIKKCKKSKKKRKKQKITV